jgi:ABC-type uncharacterized transport system permease subunit
MSAFFLGTAALYALASAVFIAYLFGRRDAVLKLARVALAAALAAHLAFIGFQCTRGMNPLRDVHGALGLSGWLLGVGYLLTTLRSRFAVIGAVVAPLSLALLVGARLTPGGAVVPGIERSAQLLGRVHIALSAAGVAVFGIAAAVALLYLLQESALKSKRVGTMFRRAPALASLDVAGRRLIMVGFPVFTLAVVSGLVWTARLPLAGSFRPEHAIAALTWTIFAALIVARVTVGLRGRRAALITLLGFAATVAVLLVYVARRLLGG